MLPTKQHKLPSSKSAKLPQKCVKLHSQIRPVMGLVESIVWCNFCVPTYSLLGGSNNDLLKANHRTAAFMVAENLLCLELFFSEHFYFFFPIELIVSRQLS